jgi:hypothetical protein
MNGDYSMDKRLYEAKPLFLESLRLHYEILIDTEMK